MTRTAAEVLREIDNVLTDVPSHGLTLTRDRVVQLAAHVDEALTDLQERPQPELTGTAREAFGGILDVATRLTDGLPERDRLVELVRVGIADLERRPQGEVVLAVDRPLEHWEARDVVDLALRWMEMDATGPGLADRVAQVRAMMAGKPPQSEPDVRWLRLLIRQLVAEEVLDFAGTPVPEWAQAVLQEEMGPVLDG